LSVYGRYVEPRQMQELEAVARVDAGDYNLMADSVVRTEAARRMARQ
jgi:hypothetical protein